MRKYFDAEGNPVPAANATSSKGCQGGCAQLVLAVILLTVIIVSITALFQH